MVVDRNMMIQPIVHLKMINMDLNMVVIMEHHMIIMVHVDRLVVVVSVSLTNTYKFPLFRVTNCLTLFFLGSTRNLPMNGSPEPPAPPPRNHDTSNSSFNDSKESNEISEAECDRDHPRGNYGGKIH